MVLRLKLAQKERIVTYSTTSTLQTEFNFRPNEDPAFSAANKVLDSPRKEVEPLERLGDYAV